MQTTHMSSFDAKQLVEQRAIDKGPLHAIQTFRICRSDMDKLQL